MKSHRAARRAGATAAALAVVASGALGAVAAGAPATAPAPAMAPAAGGYLTEGGWGRLVIEGGPKPRFHIDSRGVNGHSCALDGSVRGNVGTTPPSDPGEVPCTVRFDVRPGEVEVTPLEHEACRAQCGARAGFDGTYVVPAAGCGDAARGRVAADSLQSYRAGRWRQSADPLASLLARCDRTLSPEEDAKLRNDLAVALFHLDRRADCRAALAPLRGAIGNDDLTQLRETAPADFETWSAIARTTHHNLALCAKASP